MKKSTKLSIPLVFFSLITNSMHAQDTAGELVETPTAMSLGTLNWSLIVGGVAVALILGIVLRTISLGKAIKKFK